MQVCAHLRRHPRRLRPPEPRPGKAKPPRTQAVYRRVLLGPAARHPRTGLSVMARFLAPRPLAPLRASCQRVSVQSERSPMPPSPPLPPPPLPPPPPHWQRSTFGHPTPRRLHGVRWTLACMESDGRLPAWRKVDASALARNHAVAGNVGLILKAARLGYRVDLPPDPGTGSWGQVSRDGILGGMVHLDATTRPPPTQPNPSHPNHTPPPTPPSLSLPPPPPSRPPCADDRSTTAFR
jgi:hypothetical protein